MKRMKLYVGLTVMTILVGGMILLSYYSAHAQQIKANYFRGPADADIVIEEFSAFS